MRNTGVEPNLDRRRAATGRAPGYPLVNEKQMGDFPLARILEFMRAVVPFDQLSEVELNQVVAHIEIAYYPRGDAIIESGGDPASVLFIIHQGSVKVTVSDEQGQDILVDVRGEGDVFGAVSLLHGKRAMFSVVAQEDLLVFELEGAFFISLMDQHSFFRRYFGRSLARNIQAVQDTLSSGGNPFSGPNPLGAERLLTTTRVREVMSSEVLTCGPQATVREAARLMTGRRVGSIVVTGLERNQPLGVLTDTDLRVRVLAEDRDPSIWVNQIMSPGVRAISPQAYAFEAILEMTRHGVHHLVVSEGERMIGVISDHDLKMFTGSSPTGVARQIAKVTHLDELSHFPRRIHAALSSLLSLGCSAPYILGVITEFNDRLTIKLLELTEAELKDQGRGAAPVPFTWLLLGSAGRKEQALPLDQDHGLVYADVPATRQDEVKNWFLEFARRMVAGLESCGFKPCPHGNLASNPRWCQSESQWLETYQKWINDPDPQHLQGMGIFFDPRPLDAPGSLGQTLGASILPQVRQNRALLRYLHSDGTSHRPPVAFLRQYVVAKNGDYHEELDLKQSAVLPVVNAIRVLALEQGIPATSTMDRLAELTRRGLIDQRMAEDLREAYGFITLLGISRFLEDRDRSPRPGEVILPETLNRVQRKMLKDSFAVITRLQDQVARRYQS